MTVPRPAASAPLAAVGMLALVGALLAGCSPELEPTPTPTAAFASEEEAFAAAEETYRAYNDAGNSFRNGQPTPRPDEFLIGSALEEYLDGQDFLHNRGLSLKGTVQVSDFQPFHFDSTGKSVEVLATVCLDVSATHVEDQAGNDSTPPERPTLLAQDLRLISDEGKFLIAEEAEGEVSVCTHN